ncbi:MAG: nitrite/sulfite reductase [Hyphomicrobiaceae bacterium]|nr:nitrite/sulfite reductase [Hyphomicrobiaceae bacterium]
MYRYDEFDHAFVQTRVAQFREQVEARLAGQLTEEEFRPLRLMNGLYLQLHAYMLRIAIPYGTLSARQMRQLAFITDRFDRGSAHFTTRQNLQLNWPKLIETPDILAALAEVEMHGIQTSGNCIRNVTSDQYAGVAADEIEDPRPTGELIRQWSTDHPEFSFLPRKFKIAVTGAAMDRAAVAAHDIGIRVVRNDAGEVGYRIYVGGGLGRTPMLARLVREFLPKDDLIAYLEAIMRVYNLFGRRDNKYKARVKILMHEAGTETVKRMVEEEFARLPRAAINVDPAELARIEAYFAPPAYEALGDEPALLAAARQADAGFDAFARANVVAHKQPGYAIVNISLKPIGGAPGDATSAQMRAVADLSERYGFGEIRVTHAQNLVLPDVRQRDLPALYRELLAAGLGDANAGLITDIIACPGMDYCSLATARSIPIAKAIAQRFANPARQQLIGELGIKISGCINACGHHHLGGIGILGLEKGGEESYQITLGGDPGNDAAIGKLLGPGLAGDDVPDAIERIVDLYLAGREAGETFVAAYRRLGHDHFKGALNADRH